MKFSLHTRPFELAGSWFVFRHWSQTHLYLISHQRNRSSDTYSEVRPTEMIDYGVVHPTEMINYGVVRRTKWWPVLRDWQFFFLTTTLFCDWDTLSFQARVSSYQQLIQIYYFTDNSKTINNWGILSDMHKYIWSNY